jgi:DNA-binding PadR family transcriptional regulator
MRAAKRPNLTTPDLVLLSLLAERPMHGYQANLELERREIRDWANICRPQVYYSLEKLSRMGLLRATKTNEPAAGPDRRVFSTSENGRHALANALEWKEWATQRDRPVFQTWMALSWQARPGIFERQIVQRGKFLRKELARERATFLSICAEVGHKFHEALWMVSFAIQQIQLELRWLRRLKRALPRRAAARYPQYVPPETE